MKREYTDPALSISLSPEPEPQEVQVLPTETTFLNKFNLKETMPGETEIAPRRTIAQENKSSIKPAFRHSPVKINKLADENDASSNKNNETAVENEVIKSINDTDSIPSPITITSYREIEHENMASITPALGDSPVDKNKLAAGKEAPLDINNDKEVQKEVTGFKKVTFDPKALTSSSNQTTSDKGTQSVTEKKLCNDYVPFVIPQKPGKMMAAFGNGNTNPVVPENLFKTFNARAPLAHVINNFLPTDLSGSIRKGNQDAHI